MKSYFETNTFSLASRETSYEIQDSEIVIISFFRNIECQVAHPRTAIAMMSYCSLMKKGL